MVGHLTEEEVREVLAHNVLGRIGCSDEKGVYIVPITYVYDGRNIICHSQVGRKVQLMRKNPAVCFEVDQMQSFTNWKSVIATGRYQEIDDEQEKRQVMKVFVERMLRMRISETALLPELHEQRQHPKSGSLKTIIYRIVIEEATGRYENEST